jgi:hypothetical protein
VADQDLAASPTGPSGMCDRAQSHTANLYVNRCRMINIADRLVVVRRHDRVTGTDTTRTASATISLEVSRSSSIDQSSWTSIVPQPKTAAG